MSRWRVVLVVALVLVPFIVLAGVGSVHLWTTGYGFAFWWVMFACLATGYCLGHYWQRKRALLRPIDHNPPMYWTDRDRKAWELVKARAEAGVNVSGDKLLDFDFYVDDGQAMAHDLARFYNPGARDPVGALTIPEILTVIELASSDLGRIVDQYVPGGHLVTINDLRMARTASKWYSVATNVYWAISAIFNPVETATRFAASKLGLSGPWAALQKDLLVWFYAAYVHRLGTYLVELNSGRLRVGPQRYRELIRQGETTPHMQTGASTTAATAPAASAPNSVAAAPDPADAVARVTITLMGQVKAGKSSLVNAFLGERRALTDVLPATSEVSRYEVQPPNIPTRLILMDTAGYGHTGPKEDQLKATQQAAQQSDILLLVMHARNPARAADLSMMQQLTAWYASRPDLKMPKVLAVLTHTDLLSPAMEWAPPYDWQHPDRPKEQAMSEAATAVREQLGLYLVGVVPVCTAEGKVYGINEFLLPALTHLLDEARAVALLRVLKAEYDATKVRKVFHQLSALAVQAGRMLWENAIQPSS
jgi:predicted GTPase